MVKVEYSCEICGDSYNTRKKARECESKGKKKQVYPKGMIFQIQHEKMVFVIAKFHDRQHHASYSAWGFRDNGAGDNAPTNIEEFNNPEMTCGFDHWDSKDGIEFIREPNKNLYCFKRAKKTMKKFGIRAIVYKKNAKSVGDGK